MVTVTVQPNACMIDPTGVNALNRKVEANVGVGKEFQSVSKLWKEVRASHLVLRSS